jgi:hypothetical protein
MPIYINNRTLELEIYELFREPAVFDEKDKLKGRLVIWNAEENQLSPQLTAMKEFVALGQSKYRYSSPLEALLWGYQNGTFSAKDDPLKDYDGLLNFIKPLWGNMEGARWKDFDEVTSRLNTPELLDYFTSEKMGYKYYTSKLGSTSARYAFKKRFVNCEGFTSFTTYTMKKAGYKVCNQLVKATNLHAISVFTDGKTYYMFSNGKLSGAFKRKQDLPFRFIY